MTGLRVLYDSSKTRENGRLESIGVNSLNFLGKSDKLQVFTTDSSGRVSMQTLSYKRNKEIYKSVTL
jgi:hypothetical protein